MYLARFSYDVLPVNRKRALDFIRREVEAARSNGSQRAPISAADARPRQRRGAAIRDRTDTA
jgi:hypothetical protein